MYESLFSQSGLSLERLRGFLEMAEAGSIAGAAPGDVVRQSQISRQIRDLEAYFGSELTVRRGKTLSLTDTGRRLASIVREQFQMLEEFRIAQVGGTRTFSLSAGASTLEWLVTPSLPQIANLLGGVKLETSLNRSRSLVEKIREGSIDLGVVRRDAIPKASPKNCEPIVKLSFHLCVSRNLLPKGAGEGTVADPASWRDLPFAAGPGGGQMDRAIRDAMAGQGVVFQPKYECGSMLQVQSLVQRGGCAAILPNIALADLDRKRVLTVPFAALDHYGRTLVLHWNPRQVERRDIDTTILRQIAVSLLPSQG